MGIWIFRGAVLAALYYLMECTDGARYGDIELPPE